MLITTSNLPMSNGKGMSWGTIAIVVVIIGSLGYLGYLALQKPKTISSPKIKENERE